MKPSGNHEPTIEVKQALGHILKKGDLIDGEPRITKIRSFLSSAALIGAGFVGPLADAPFTVEMVAGASFLAGATLVKRVIGGPVHNKTKKDRIKTHTAANELTTEPIDIFRTGKGKQATLAMRWYGMDTAPAHPSRIVDLARTAREGGIATIAANADYLCVDDSLAVSASTYIADAKEAGRGKFRRNTNPANAIWDTAVCENVVELSVDEFEKAALDYVSEREVSQIDAIVTQLNILRITELHAAFKENNSKELYDNLVATILRHIEYDGGETETLIERLPDGTPIRSRATSLPSITANDVAVYNDIQSMLSHAPKRSYAGTVELGAWVGLGSNAALLEHTASQPLDSLNQQQLLAALHLLLTDNNPDIKRYDAAAQDDTKQSPVRPLLSERLYAEPIEASDKWMNRSIRAAAAFALVSAGVIGGLTETYEANAAYAREQAAFYAQEDGGIMSNRDPAYQRYKNEVQDFGSLSDRAIIEFDNTAYKTIDAYTLWLAQTLVDRIGIPKEFGDYANPYYSGTDYDSWIKRVGLKTPNQETATRSNYSIGDGATDNHLLFTVKALHGGSTEGYYYSDISDEMFLDATKSKILHGGTVGYGRSDDSRETRYSSARVNEIVAMSPDYMIETPYIGINSTYITEAVTMPLRADMKLLGAAVVDASDPQKAVPLDYVMRENGASYALLRNDVIEKLVKMDVNRPVLRYWAIQTPNVSNIQTRYTHMSARTYRHGNIEIGKKFHQSELDEVAKSVRKSLGLGADASMAEIYMAVQDKHLYAYTPFAYEKDTHEIPKDDDVAALKEIGRILAERETLNCNMAASLASLATIDHNTTLYATGFREDGDGVLSSIESHAWLYDPTKEEIVETTPFRFAPGVTTPKLETLAPTESASVDGRSSLAYAGGAAIILAMAWRRRQKLAELADTARAYAVLGTSSGKKKLGEQIHELYARPGDTHTEALPSRYKSIGFEEAVSSFVSNIPTGSGTVGMRLNSSAIRRERERQKKLTAS